MKPIDKQIWRLALAAVLIPLTLSCGKYAFVDCETYDFNDCIFDRPETGELTVLVSQGEDGHGVPVIIWAGTWPSQDTVDTDTITSEEKTYFLPTDRTYSVTAYYIRDGKQIIAVDGDDIDALSYDVCDEVCWDVKNARADVRLKY